MKFVIRAIVVHRDVWVSASKLRLLKRYFGGQIIKKNSIVNKCCFQADHHCRRWVLRLLDLTPDCSKSDVIHPLLVALRSCVPGIHQECKWVWNTRWGERLATRCSAAGCILTTVILVIEVVRVIRSVHFQVWLGSFRINAFVSLPLQESMALHGAGKHDQWRG